MKMLNPHLKSISAILLLAFITSCHNSILKEGIKQEGDPIDDWYGEKKEGVVEFRNKWFVIINPDKFHGLGIHMNDIDSMRNNAADEGKTLHSIYLMPYKKDGDISFMVAPVYAANRNVKLDSAIIETGASQVYNSYILCPDDCPKIRWNREDSDDDAQSDADKP